jgi:hypothetical protein
MGIIRKFASVIGLVAIATGTLAFAGTANATPVPPVASTALLGTWVNTNPASNSVKQIVIQPYRTGAVLVDAFGACVPTLCEWGRVLANIYGTSVSSTAGIAFQTDQRFLIGIKEWSRTQLFGTVAKTPVGLRLTVREFTAFEDGSGRHNYTQTETFALGDSKQAVTKSGLSTTSYVVGQPPALNGGTFGTWVPSGPSNNIAKIVIGGTPAAPTVHAYGVCSPTPCDWGTVRGVTYGTTISTVRGTTVLAPYTFSFKRTQLLLKYTIGTDDVEHLTVVTYNEFTDGSGRSNYTNTQSLVHV